MRKLPHRNAAMCLVLSHGVFKRLLTRLDNSLPIVHGNIDVRLMNRTQSVRKLSRSCHLFRLKPCLSFTAPIVLNVGLHRSESRWHSDRQRSSVLLDCGRRLGQGQQLRRWVNARVNVNVLRALPFQLVPFTHGLGPGAKVHFLLEINIW